LTPTGPESNRAIGENELKDIVGKKSERRSLPEDAAALIDLIISEIQNPSDMQKLLDNLPVVTTCPREISEFLKAKDRAQRRMAFINTEAIWFRKYGWFMARIVILFGLIIIVFAIATRGGAVDFITSTILGAASYYLLLVTLSNIRYRDKNRKRLKLVKSELDKYQREIIPIAGSLLKRFEVDSSRYPVSEPKNPAGLERREGGYFIPVD
jgi:hypothetical protein